VTGWNNYEIIALKALKWPLVLVVDFEELQQGFNIMLSNRPIVVRNGDTTTDSGSLTRMSVTLQIELKAEVLLLSLSSS
jgi:hypothetical protein